MTSDLTLISLATSATATLSVTDVAALLGLDARTVSRACQDGQLPSLRVGRRLLVPRLPLLALLGVESGREKTDQGPTHVSTVNRPSTIGLRPGVPER